MKKVWLLIFSLATSHLSGIIGSLSTTPNIDGWYRFLEKPVFNPPNWVFGPVWFTLYTLMGIAIYLVLRSGLDSKRKRWIVSLYFIHLFFNSLWSIVFFGNQNPAGAFGIILILLLMIIALTYLFFKEKKASGYLFLPYLAWVSFAAILNYFIWQLNI